MSAWTRFFSGHRWGWYRYAVAYVGPTIVGVVGSEATSIPASIGWVPIVAFGVALMWWLPGPRQGAGFSDEGVVVRRWLRRRTVSWTDISLIRLGLISWGRGGSLGAQLIVRNGRNVRLPGLPWWARWRDPALAPLVTCAGAHHVPTRVDPEQLHHFPAYAFVPEGEAGASLNEATDRAHRLSRRWTLVIAGITLVAVGITAVMLRRDLELADHGRRVDAKVLWVRPRSDGSRFPETTKVRVRFTFDGKDVAASVRTTRQKVGPTIAIVVDPDDPSRTRAVHGPERPWRVPLFFAAVGLVLVVGLGLENLSYWRWQQRRDGRTGPGPEQA